jgi:hypothetical protein
VFAVVIVYVAIIAAKLVRLQRQTAELLELAERQRERVAVTTTATTPTDRHAEAT